jgi:hypothetical protein
MKIGLFILLGIVIVVGWIACSTPRAQEEPLSKEQKIIRASIEAHGGKDYEKAAFSFDFRNRSYSFKNNKGLFEYTMREEKEDKITEDILTNDRFERKVNGEIQKLSEEDVAKYSGSLTSVIYFVLLPYKLNDPAVLLKDKGETTIKGEAYDVMEIRFKEEGGVEDFHDIYYYWINQETHFVDYLAYQFLVDDGSGTRFRAAYNQITSKGIRFQDYGNYKSTYETPLDSLPILFENENLEKLSVIELENLQPM